jgi:Spy/CpxP family protein refolding chaperone
MQTETISRIVGSFVGATVIAMGFLAFTPASSAAQDPNQAPPADGRHGGPRGGGPGGPGGPGGRGGRFGGPMAFGLDPRDLSEEQRAQIKAIRDRHAEELKPLIEQSQAARKALQDNVMTGGGNLRGLALDLGTAEGNLAFANAEIQIEILSVLTPEQRQKMDARQKEMEARRAEMDKMRK